MEANVIFERAGLRLSLLTPCLLRVEKGNHTDLPTQTVWNRDFGPVEAKVDEIASVGMKYLVLLDTAIVYNDYAESYFDTDIFPFADMACKDPMGAVLTAADRNGMKVFVSCGFYGNCYHALNNMTSPEVTERAFKAMEQLWAKYGHHESFYG